jgi:hypothetical protein
MLGTATVLPEVSVIPSYAQTAMSVSPLYNAC